MSKMEMKSRKPMALVNRGRNDDADSNRHCTNQNRKRRVVFLDYLFPQIVRRELIHQNECNYEDQNPKKREDYCTDHIAQRNEVHLIFLLCNGDSCCIPTGRNLGCRGPIWVRS